MRKDFPYNTMFFGIEIRSFRSRIGGAKLLWFLGQGVHFGGRGVHLLTIWMHSTLLIIAEVACSYHHIFNAVPCHADTENLPPAAFLHTKAWKTPCWNRAPSYHSLIRLPGTFCAILVSPLLPYPTPSSHLPILLSVSVHPLHPLLQDAYMCSA